MPEPFADLGGLWVLVAAGAFLVGISIKYLRIMWHRRRHWTLAEARVGKVRTRTASASGGDGGTYVNYHYTDASGQQHMGVHEPTLRKPKRNSTLLVRYDPENPSMSETVMPLWMEWAIGLGGIGMGAGLALATVTVFNS